MKKNLKKLSITLIAILTISIGTLRSQSFNPFLAAKLDSTLIMGVPQQVKGITASVYYPGQGIWRGTYGVSYAGHPITNDMEFGIASNTKLFTASTIMKLIEANKLDLNDHLGKWIHTKYNNIDSTILIRQLLNHTSGLADNSITFFDSAIKYPNHVFTVTEVLSYQAPKVYNPGGGYNYSNTNYMLLGMVAESVTGITISKLIRDSILTPRNLDSTFYSFQEPILGTIAHPWVSGVDDAANSRIGLNSASGAAGAIYSTAADMVKWYNAFFTGQVVNPSSLALMTTFTGTGNYGYALVKRVVLGRTTWGHDGKTLGYLSEMFYDPITKAIASGISNSDSASVSATTFLLLKAIADNLPDTAKTITGNKTVCQGTNSVTYTVPAIPRATSYTWTFPNGVTGSSQTNSITVNFGNTASSGNVTVSGTNLYGNGRPGIFPVTVNLQAHNVSIQTSCNSYTWNGTTYNSSGLYTYNYNNLNGCISVDTLKLTIVKGTHNVSKQTACNSYTWNGTTYSNSGTYVYNYNNANGCVSADTLKLTINKIAPVNNTVNLNNCDSLVYNGVVYKNSTSFTDTIKTAGGCDSVYASVNILINNLSISGGIYHPSKGYSISNVAAIMNGTLVGNTNGKSNYKFGCLSALSTETITLNKNNDINKANGVTALDIALVQGQILQKSLLNNPYKIIAADVNGDGKISALDIVFMKRLILGLDTTFTSSTTKQNRLWVFVDSTYNFLDATNPFPFKDSISYSGLNAPIVNQTFIGLKLGDVDWSWNPAIAKPNNNEVNAVEFSYPSNALNNSGLSDEVRIPIRLKNFKDMLGMQFTFGFNATELQWVGIDRNMLHFELGTNHSHEGKVSFLWNDSANTAKTLEDSSTIFELVFKRTGKEAMVNTLKLDGSITAVEAIDKDYSTHEVLLKKIETILQQTNESWVVAPNPAKDGVIQVQMNLSEKKIIVFRLLDNTGKLLFIKQVESDKGNSHFTLKDGNVPTGSYFLQATGVEGSDVKKILIQ